jgi:hypothetical protein
LKYDATYFIKLRLLLTNDLERSELAVLIETCTRGFLNQAEKLLGLHVDYLYDAALHDQEMRIIDIKLNLHKERLDLVCSLHFTIHHVFALALEYGTTYDDFILTHHSWGRCLLVSIIKDYSDTSLCYASIALFVNQFL